MRKNNEFFYILRFLKKYKAELQLGQIHIYKNVKNTILVAI